MDLLTQATYHINEEQIIAYDSTSINNIRIKATIALITDKFVDFQKDLLMEFIADLSNEASKDDTSFRSFKNYVEFALQELNSKLAVFAEKVTDTPSFDIRGIVEVFYNQEYLASMIGDVSFIILRNKKIYYTLFNETSKRVKISLFSDFVEGDVSNGDEIITIGSDIAPIVDNNDLIELNDIIGSTNQDFLGLLIETIEQRAGQGITVFESYTQVKAQNTINTIPQSTNKLKSKISNWFILNQYQVGMIIFGCIIFGLLYSIISNYRTQYGNTIVKTESGKEVDITLESIKKDISLFQRLDATSPTKITTYHDIKNKIELLKKNNQSPLDIRDLEKVLEEEYYKGFRITTVNQFDTSILDFTDSDTQTLGTILGIYIGKEGFHIGGSKASLIGGINNKLKGTLIRYSEELLSDPLVKCNSSLGKAGLYCYDNKGQIYLITKSGIESVKNSATANNFPAPIMDIGTFASSNMYILTQNSDLTKIGAHVVRYQAVANNPSNLREPLNYTISGSGSSTASFESMAIDGTFIMWNNKTKQLIQLRRDGTTSKDRVIPTKGGDNIEGAYSNTGISVIAYDTSKYVYLRDSIQGSLTVFTSAPSKVNDQNKTNFTLEYVMRVKFDKSLGVKGVIISDAVRPELWAVTSKGVFLYNLSQDIEQYANQPKTQ